MAVPAGSHPMHRLAGTVKRVTMTHEAPSALRRRILDGLGLAARLLLAGVWLISGWLKASDPIETRVAVRAYQLLPDDVSDLVAAVLPYAEIAVGVILLAGLATRIGGILSTLMLIAFLFGVISAAARGLSIDCGCFGGGGQVEAGATAYTEEIVRDTVFLIAAVYLLVRPRSWLSIDGWVRRRQAVTDGAAEGDTDPHDAA